MNLIAARPLARPIDQGYRLNPGDVVRVVAWGGTTQNFSVPIDPSGTLGLPGVGAVPVSGLTIAEAQTRVVDLVRSQYRNAGVVLTVEQASATGVTVTGEVTGPGYLALPAGGTVLEALSAAGGVLPTGTLRAISVRNSTSDTPRIIDLYRLAVDGDATLLTPLPPGASVHVPAAGPIVQVFGAAKRPCAVELLPGQPLVEALRLAGGPATTADPAILLLARELESGQQVQALTLADLTHLAARDDDRLRLSDRRDVSGGTPTIIVEGRIRTPGTHAWSPGLTVAQAIAAAGGLLPAADPARAVIERTLATPRVVDLGGGVVIPAYRDLISAGTPGTVLEALDRLIVPAAPAIADQGARISVDGAVNKPGNLPFTPGMTVRDALNLAGGPLANAQIEIADLVHVVVGENGERDVTRESLDLRPVLRGEPGPALKNLDALVLRARNDVRVKVTIAGEVKNTGSFVLPRGATLAQAVVIAGGLTADAFPSGAQFFRASEAVEQQRLLTDLAGRLERAVIVNRNQLNSVTTPDGQMALQSTIANQEAELVRMRNATATGRLAGIDLTGSLANVPGADLVLQDGDRLIVPAKPGTVRVIGEVMVPCSLRWEKELRPADAIRRSGGTTSQADEDRIFVVRADGSVVASASFAGSAWDAGSRRWVRTSLNRMNLAEGDTVIVPADLVYHRDGLEVTKDITQILFQVAAATGTIRLLSK